MSEKFAFWKTMDGTHKLTFVLLIAVTITFPVFLLALLNPKSLTFSRASMPATPPDAINCIEVEDNLLKNSSFEKNLRAWIPGKYTKLTVSKTDSAHCAKSVVLHAKKPEDYESRLTQNIKLETDSNYELSFFVKGGTPSVENQSVFISYADRKKESESAYVDIGYFDVGDNWRLHTTQFSTYNFDRDNFDPSKLRIVFTPANPNQLVYFDNIVLKKIESIINTPTPTTTLLTLTPTLTIIPTATNTPTPAPREDQWGVYKIVNQPKTVNIICTRGQQCDFSDPVIYQNITDKPLYETTLLVLSERGGEAYVQDEKRYVFKDQVFYPGQGPNVFFIATPNGLSDTASFDLLIDGKQCNTDTTPRDCYFMGGTVFTVNFRYVD